jgi:tetratricopeptide (TPR) repeat protein
MFNVVINLGGLLMRDGREAEALKEFAEAARLSPENPMAHFDLGTLLFEQGKFGEAASQFSVAVKWWACLCEIGRSPGCACLLLQNAGERIQLE